MGRGWPREEGRSNGAGGGGVLRAECDVIIRVGGVRKEGSVGE